MDQGLECPGRSLLPDGYLRMLKTNCEQTDRIKDAQKLAQLDSGITTLSACCVRAGFKLGDTLAINNKEAIAVLRNKFERRKLKRQQSLPFALRTGINDVTARQIGYKFSQTTYRSVKRARAAMEKEPKQQGLGAYGVLASSISSTSVGVSTDTRRWLAYGCAHAAYDLENGVVFEETTKEIIEQICDTPSLKQEAQAHSMWLKEIKHCKFTWDASDHSAKIVSILCNLGQCSSAIVLLSLIYFGRNSRQALDQWCKVCTLRATELRQAVWDILGDKYPIDSKRFPVSAATGYVDSLQKGDTHDAIRYKVSLLTTVQAHNMLCSYNKEPGFLRDWRRIQRITQSSMLQAMMISRVWCKAFGLKREGDDEAWPKYAITAVPARWKRSSPGQLGRDLRVIAQSFPVVTRITSHAEQCGYKMWSGCHMEHLGCEIRKFNSKGSWIRRDPKFQPRRLALPQKPSEGIFVKTPVG